MWILHTFAICENNKIFCWGYNSFGQLGLGDNVNRNKPVEFQIKGNLSIIKEIICGHAHTFAICENKKIYCCGRDHAGQLGLGHDKTSFKIFEFSNGKEEWEFFGTEEKNNKLEWKEIKFLFIAFYKENKKTCPLYEFSKQND